MSKNTPAEKTPDTPTAEPVATAVEGGVADAVEQPAEVETIVEYVPTKDDGLTSIDDVDEDPDTEVHPDDAEWGYGDLEDREVADPIVVAEHAKAAAAEKESTDD